MRDASDDFAEGGEFFGLDEVALESFLFVEFDAQGDGEGGQFGKDGEGGLGVFVKGVGHEAVDVDDAPDGVVDDDRDGEFAADVVEELVVVAILGGVGAEVGNAGEGDLAGDAFADLEVEILFFQRPVVAVGGGDDEALGGFVDGDEGAVYGVAQTHGAVENQFHDLIDPLAVPYCCQDVPYGRGDGIVIHTSEVTAQDMPEKGHFIHPIFNRGKVGSSRFY